MRVCRNSHKLKIPLATTICGEGDFDKRGVLTPTSSERIENPKAQSSRIFYHR